MVMVAASVRAMAQPPTGGTISSPPNGAAAAAARAPDDTDSPPAYDERGQESQREANVAAPVPQRWDGSAEWPRQTLRPPSLSGALPDEGPVRYGGQIVLADLAGLLGAIVVGTTTDNAGLGLGMYLLAAPAVHLAHGKPGTAAGSLLLHIGAPIAGAFLGLALGSTACTGGDFDFCGVGGLLLGGLAGMAGATTIDAVGLARKTPDSRSASLVPIVNVARSGSTTIGIGGRF